MLPAFHHQSRKVALGKRLEGLIILVSLGFAPACKGYVSVLLHWHC